VRGSWDVFKRRAGLRMDLKAEDREEAWLLLADLFFLDTEHPDALYQTAAERLKHMGFGREDTETILIYEVAPVAGANLGYLFYPVIGAWGGFERESLCREIGAYLKRRVARPRWHYFLQDFCMRRMVRRLEPEKLLSRLQRTREKQVPSP
jgi:hypothetical protein